MALQIEALDKDQLVDKRAKKALNIQLLKADTLAKAVQVKMAQQLHAALIGAEDALRLSVTIEPATDPLKALKIQRRVVLELTDLLDQLRMQVELGETAVDKIFHTAYGYDDMSEDRRKLLKKFTDEKEIEEKERLQKAQQLAAKQAAEQYKWPGGGRERGGYGNPYYYGSDNQY